MAQFSDYKSALEYALLDVIVQGLEQGTVHDYETAEMSSYILNNLDFLDSQEDIIEFLADLADIWPAFTQLYKREKEKYDAHGNIFSTQEAENMHDAHSKLQSMQGR